MRGASYLRAAAGVAPRSARVLRPPRKPAWDLAGIAPSERPAEPAGANRPTVRNSAVAPAPAKLRPAHPAAEAGKNIVPAPAKLSLAQPAVKPDPPKPEAVFRSNPRKELRPQMGIQEPIAPRAPQPVAAEPPVLSNREFKAVEPVVPPGAPVPPTFSPSPPPTAEIRRTAPENRNADPSAPRKKPADQRELPPAEVIAPISGFGRFEKAATESHWRQPELNPPGDREQASWAEPSIVIEKRKAPEPDRNTVHIGRVEIQIAPPPEPPRRSAPRSSGRAPLLSRGYPAWYGLKQG